MIKASTVFPSVEIQQLKAKCNKTFAAKITRT